MIENIQKHLPIINLLEGVKGKTLGEVDKSHQNKLYYFMPYIIKGKGVRDLYFVKIA